MRRVRKWKRKFSQLGRLNRVDIILGREVRRKKKNLVWCGAREGKEGECGTERVCLLNWKRLIR